MRHTSTDPPTKLKYRAPPNFLSASLTATLLNSVPRINRSGHDCVVCLLSLRRGDVVCLNKTCGHEFHRSCLERSLAASPRCPICREHVGRPQGTCPSGKMTIKTLDNEHCAGFEHTSKGTIRITYTMKSGIQLPYHQNPGQRYESTTRIAYLPNNGEGTELLLRLQSAWMSGLSFTIGTSLTTKQSNVVTWTSIHHKTLMRNGPHGFPDQRYFGNCHSNLDALGVPRFGALHPFRPPAISQIPTPLPVVVPPTVPVPVPPPPPASSPSATLPPPVLPPPPTNPAFVVLPSSTAPSPSAPLASAGPPASTVVSVVQPMPTSQDYDAPTMSQFRLSSAKTKGTCPSGQMVTKRLANISCAGFEHASNGTIEITYKMPSGVQLPYHQNPGHPYEGITRTAYLPANDEGEALLRRLWWAWSSGLSFTIGTSLTTSLPNSITWSSICHKSGKSGGGPHSFPDPLYFYNCNRALDKLSVPQATECTLKRRFPHFCVWSLLW